MPTAFTEDCLFSALFRFCCSYRLLFGFFPMNIAHGTFHCHPPNTAHPFPDTCTCSLCLPYTEYSGCKPWQLISFLSQTSSSPYYTLCPISERLSLQVQSTVSVKIEFWGSVKNSFALQYTVMLSCSKGVTALFICASLSLKTIHTV